MFAIVWARIGYDMNWANSKSDGFVATFFVIVVVAYAEFSFVRTRRRRMEFVVTSHPASKPEAGG